MENTIDKKYINLLFAGTSNFLKYACVTVMSALENLDENTSINAYYLYADIVEPFETTKRDVLIEQVLYTFKDKDVKFEFIDVTDKMYLFENLNTGMWGQEISMTHYTYLLAPLYINNVDKIIYCDCDLIVNCNLKEIFDIDMGDKLITLASPSGFEIEKETCNSGFSVLNLKQWHIEDTLKDLIQFGENLPKSDFCDQYLLNEYFKKHSPDRLILIDKTYNLFPITYADLNLEEIKNLHYAGANPKPWNDLECAYRGSFLWWKYARKTAFYETFINDYIHAHLQMLNQNIEFRQNAEAQNNIYIMHQMLKKYDNKKYKLSVWYRYFVKPYKNLLRSFIAIKVSFFDR
ncbi:hypothetical protein IKE67_02565 [bacterium]|nr:hypothetical protein [bacterium]